MIVLGVDQGLANIGYALLHFRGLDDFDVIESGNIKTTPDQELKERISTIYHTIDSLFEKVDIEVLGCERFFFNAKDKSLTFRSATIVKTNMVTGVLFLLADKHNIPIKDFVPGTVKKKVAGHGRATKEMMIQAVKERCVNHAIAIKTDHEADAIAIALTVGDHFLTEMKGE